MSLEWCQINPIHVHLQKVWKFLVKIQLTKSDPKRTRCGKCPLSCQLGLGFSYHCLIMILRGPWIMAGLILAQQNAKIHIAKLQKR